QVAESFAKYGKYHKLSMALLIGGVSFGDQEAKLDRGVDVLIATPGRLLDHFERGKLMLSGVQILVVDECDRMLDMGFIPDVERICKLMPQRHQTLFFSATLSKEIKRLTDQFLDDPKLIEVAPPASPAETVEQKLVVVGPREKSKTLKTLIADDEVSNAIVFCNRKVEVKSVYLSLKRAGISVGQLHGDMAQPDRMDMLARFKQGEVKVLVASDVAARGLDIPRVSHVFNYDVPHNAEDYVHRIGRTGRAGRKGVAVTIATPADAEAVQAIEKLIGKSIPQISIDGVKGRALAPVAESERAPRRGRRGGRRRGSPGGDAAAGETASGRQNRMPEAGAPASGPDDGKRHDKSQRRPRQAKGPRDDRSRAKPRAPAPEGKRAEPVVGLGDHVPAFLKRPVRRGQ
ncbi:MAG: DEAD/DEAH box helicase, partial [Rhodothalassiaceae bacterium]